MAGSDPNPARALEWKEKGNKCFQSGNYVEAEALYTKAIDADPTNPLLYTNRSLTNLNLQNYSSVIPDAELSIHLLPQNMKAYYHLAQAHIALHHTSEALQNAKMAHSYCVDEIHHGGKGGSSIGSITELVLKCKKEWWEEREEERLKGREGLLGDVVEALRAEKRISVEQITGGKGGDVAVTTHDDGMIDEDETAFDADGDEIRQAIKDVEESYEKKIEEVRRVFQIAGEGDPVLKRRKVPDWCIDNITFSVMFDPVVTKTGQSYDRSSIMEHLKRSQTDPLTREPLRIEDLRPNLVLRIACEDFLRDNGWAVDW